MPKNKGKGAKTRARTTQGQEKRELLFKEDGQDYAQVQKLLGNGRFELHCFGDSQKRLGHVRGKMHKKVWIQVGDVVLVGLRDYQDEKTDIIHKYNAEEVRQLKVLGELPSTVGANANETGEGMGEQEDAGPYEFEDDLDAL